MPIDPQLILSAGKAIPPMTAPDPLEQYGKALTLRHLLQQGELADVQTQTARQAFAEQQGVRDVFSRAAPGSTIEALLPELMRASPKIGLEYQTKAVDAQAKRATTAHTQAQTQDLNAGHVAAAWAALAKSGGSDEGVRIAHDMMAPYVGEAEAKAVTDSLLSLPPDQRLASSVAHAAGHKVGQEAIKLFFPAAHMQDFGGAVAPVNTSTLPGGPAPGSVIPGAQPIAKTMTPGEVQTGRHQQVMEGQGAARLGLERERVGLERARLGTVDPTDPRTETSIQYWADVLRKGGSLPPGLARNRDGAALVKEVMKRVAQGDTTPAELLASQAEFGGEKAGQRTLGNRTAQIEMAVNEARNVIPLAVAASDKVSRTNYPTLNSVILAAEKGTGDSDVVQLGVATNSLINVYARAISPTGTPTVSDKDHAREILSSAYAKGQYRAAVDMMEREMQAAQQSPGQVKKSMRDQFTGRTAEPAPTSPQRRASDRAQGQLVDALPDARQNAGKLLIGDDGTRWRSDGASWKRER